jgi:Holliday junction resolvase RusA-like endonuclease
MTRGAAATRPVARSKQPQDGSGTPGVTVLAGGSRVFALGAPGGTQRLVVEDFPSTADARALSPNGRAHWATKNAARKEVASAVKIEGTRSGLHAASGPVRLTFCYVFPDRRKRDIDNLTTGVTKVAIDALVRGRWLAADDSEHVVGVQALAVVQRGRRALEIIIEPVGG